MPKINKPGSGHVAPGPDADGTKYLEYTNAKYLKTLEKAIKIIDDKIKGSKSCDTAFKALPGGRTFSAVWADPAVWLNFDPKRHIIEWATTNGNDITITEYALAMGHWTVAATLVHELAHVNGAGSADTSAEDTLKKCLLGGLHEPGVIGTVRKQSTTRTV